MCRDLKWSQIPLSAASVREDLCQFYFGPAEGRTIKDGVREKSEPNPRKRKRNKQLFSGVPTAPWTAAGSFPGRETAEILTYRQKRFSDANKQDPPNPPVTKLVKGTRKSQDTRRYDPDIS